MEEFKIIHLNTAGADEEDELEVDEPKAESFDDGEYVAPKKRYIFLFLLIIAAAVGMMVWHTVSTYMDYDVQNSWERNDAKESHYVEFKNNVLKYSTDGVFYTTFSGGLIWNYTHDMVNPILETSDDYVVVYDKKGTEIELFSQNGFVNTVKTRIPIISVKVANQGTIAVMLQENGISYLQLYDTRGTVLVSGEIHPKNGGYPISIALSSDSTRLAVSVLNLNSGTVRSDVIFYDFSSLGKEKEDNIIATYTYVDLIIPQIVYLDDDKAVAFGENEIIIFNNNDQVTVAKEIYINSEINSIFYNKKHIGFVTNAADEDGVLQNKVTVYNLLGFKLMDKCVNDDYDDVILMENDEICLIKENELSIYNLVGFNRFHSTFGERVYAVFPGVTSKRYYILNPNTTDEIVIK